MHNFIGPILLVLSASILQAKEPELNQPPEKLISKNCIAYLRFDGMQKHKKAYDKTILAEMMRKEFGEFAYHLWDLGKQGFLESAVININDAKRAKKIGANLKVWHKPEDLINIVWDHGFIYGLEVEELGKDDTTSTIIIPNVGAKGKTVINFVNALPILFGDDSPIKKNRVGNKEISFLPDLPNFVGWWQENDHVVVVSSSLAPSIMLKRMEKKSQSLLDNELFKRSQTKVAYEDCVRGFLDLKQVLNHFLVMPEAGKESLPLIERVKRRLTLSRLGLMDLERIELHYGFQGAFQRSSLTLHLRKGSKRRGLLEFLPAPIKVTEANLPVLPKDATTVTIYGIRWTKAFDEVCSLIQLAAARDVFLGNEAPKEMLNPKAYVTKQLGFDLQSELFEHLDNSFLHYRTLDDGPWILGTTLAVKLKNPAKAEKSLRRLLSMITTLEAELEQQVIEKHSTCRGVKLTTFIIRGSPVSPCYTFDKGWFFLSLNPQAIKMQIARNRGEYAGLQQSPRFKKLINDNKERGMISYADMRPRLQRLLPFAPLLAMYFTAPNEEVFGGEKPVEKKKKLLFDPAMIPPTNMITALLKPNTMLLLDHSDSISFESEFSILMPSIFWLSILSSNSITELDPLNKFEDPLIAK